MVPQGAFGGGGEQGPPGWLDVGGSVLAVRGLNKPENQGVAAAGVKGEWGRGTWGDGSSRCSRVYEGREHTRMMNEC